MGFLSTSHVVRTPVGRVSDAEARKLLKDYAALVALWANKAWYQSRKSACLDLDDLLSLAQTALVEAHATWDETRQVARLTWYSRTIKQRLAAYTAQLQDLDRADVQARAHHNKHRKRVAEYAKEHGVKPEDVDPDAAGIEPIPESSKRRWEAAERRGYLSTDMPAGEESTTTLGDLLFVEEDRDEGVVANERRAWLYAIMDEVLTPRERDALVAWLDGLPMTEVASCQNITRQRFSAIRSEALAKVYYAATGVVLEPTHSVDAYLAQIEKMPIPEVFERANRSERIFGRPPGLNKQPQYKKTIPPRADVPKAVTLEFHVEVSVR